MNDVLVTGGAGFIGSHVADHLLRSGLSVVIVDDLSGGFRRNLPKGAVFHKASVTDSAAMARVFRNHKFQYVFHLAAYAAEGLSPFIRRFNYENNLIGTTNLINHAVSNDVECFVYTSSIAVYGKQSPPFTEAMAPSPSDPYGIAKYAAELDLRAAAEQFGLKYIIFRPHNVYGERQNLLDPYRNVIGIFMRQILQGEPCTIFGDGTQSRAFSYIDDVAPRIARSIAVPAAMNQMFNIGADQAVAVRDLAELLQEQMGRRVGVQHLAPRNEAVHAFADHSRACQVFGEHPVTDIREGVKRMANWAKTLDDAPMRPFAHAIEIQKGLPAAWHKKKSLSRRHTSVAVGN
jgi:UDP-glucose 4-epimerase